MPEVTSPVPGHFCWFELSTTDQASAKNFYMKLFGWDAHDIPMGPESAYTTFKLGGRDVGAACTLQSEQKAHGVPPHWATYVTVVNADETAAKCASLGGNVLAPAFDVFDIGRMAVLQDPTGATFSIWQPKKHQGVAVLREPGAFSWSELMTRDTASATRFYTGLFGWGTKISDGAGFTYTHWQAGGTDIGGMMAITPEMGPVPPHWLNYITVTDCDASAAQATALGARILVPPTDIPNTGRFSVLQDPQSAVFAIFAPGPMHKT